MNRKGVTNREVNIIQVIKDRLKLQTTQRYLFDQFEIKNPTYEVITSSSFLGRLRLWDDGLKKAFYLLVGGGSNLLITKTFYEQLLISVTNNINIVKGESIKEMDKV